MYLRIPIHSFTMKKISRIYFKQDLEKATRYVWFRNCNNCNRYFLNNNIYNTSYFYRVTSSTQIFLDTQKYLYIIYIQYKRVAYFLIKSQVRVWGTALILSKRDCVKNENMLYM